MGEKNLHQPLEHSNVLRVEQLLGNPVQAALLPRRGHGGRSPVRRNKHIPCPCSDPIVFRVSRIPKCAVSMQI